MNKFDKKYVSLNAKNGNCDAHCSVSFDYTDSKQKLSLSLNGENNDNLGFYVVVKENGKYNAYYIGDLNKKSEMKYDLKKEVTKLYSTVYTLQDVDTVLIIDTSNGEVLYEGNVDTSSQFTGKYQVIVDKPIITKVIENVDKSSVSENTESEIDDKVELDVEPEKIIVIGNDNDDHHNNHHDHNHNHDHDHDCDDNGDGGSGGGIGGDNSGGSGGGIGGGNSGGSGGGIGGGNSGGSGGGIGGGNSGGSGGGIGGDNSGGSGGGIGGGNSGGSGGGIGGGNSGSESQNIVGEHVEGCTCGECRCKVYYGAFKGSSRVLDDDDFEEEVEFNNEVDLDRYISTEYKNLNDENISSNHSRETKVINISFKPEEVRKEKASTKREEKSGDSGKKSKNGTKANDFYDMFMGNKNNSKRNNGSFVDMLNYVKKEFDSIREIMNLSDQEFSKHYGTVDNSKNFENAIKRDNAENDFKETKKVNSSESIKNNNGYSINTNNPVIKLINSREEVKPFEMTDKSVRWVSIKLNEVVGFFDDYWKLFWEPFVVNSYSENKHLLLGVENIGNGKKQIEKYYFAVPYTYNEDLSNEAYELGFEYFEGVDNSNDEITDGVNGYFIKELVDKGTKLEISEFQEDRVQEKKVHETHVEETAFVEDNDNELVKNEFVKEKSFIENFEEMIKNITNDNNEFMRDLELIKETRKVNDKVEENNMNLNFEDRLTMIENLVNEMENNEEVVEDDYTDMHEELEIGDDFESYRIGFELFEESNNLNENMSEQVMFELEMDENQILKELLKS